MTNPCKECIVLAMCKARFNEFANSNREPQVRNFALSGECQLLKDYLNIFSVNTVSEIREFYGLSPIYYKGI